MGSPIPSPAKWPSPASGKTIPSMPAPTSAHRPTSLSATATATAPPGARSRAKFQKRFLKTTPRPGAATTAWTRAWFPACCSRIGKSPTRSPPSPTSPQPSCACSACPPPLTWTASAGPGRPPPPPPPPAATSFLAYADGRPRDLCGTGALATRLGTGNLATRVGTGALACPAERQLGWLPTLVFQENGRPNRQSISCSLWRGRPRDPFGDRQPRDPCGDRRPRLSGRAPARLASDSGLSGKWAAQPPINLLLFVARAPSRPVWGQAPSPVRPSASSAGFRLWFFRKMGGPTANQSLALCGAGALATRVGTGALACPAERQLGWLPTLVFQENGQPNRQSISCSLWRGRPRDPCGDRRPRLSGRAPARLASDSGLSGKWAAQPPINLLLFVTRAPSPANRLPDTGC